MSVFSSRVTLHGNVTSVYDKNPGIIQPSIPLRLTGAIVPKKKDVDPKDEDGVDGRGVCGWDGWVGGLGAVGVSSIFGLVRGVGAFVEVLPTFVLVSRIHLAQRYRGNATSFSAASSS